MSLGSKIFGLLLFFANILNAQVIKSTSLIVTVDSNGVITRVANGDGLGINVCGQTELQNCTITTSKLIKNTNGIEMVRFARKTEGNAACRILEKIYAAGDGIRWDVEINGNGEPWSTPIETRMKVADSNKCLFWTAWGTPGTAEQDKYRWQSPLKSDVFKNRDLSYGATSPDDFQTTSMPIASVMLPKQDWAFSIFESLDDLIFNMRIKTSQDGDIIFQRSNHRISKSGTIKFSVFLVGHRADSRAAMKAIVNRYPEKFDPPVERTFLIAGNGGYSSFEGPLDARTLHLLGFSFNWKASFDYPYMGMFLPPVDYNEAWIGDLGRPVTIAQMRKYSQDMRNMGFHVLNYFNVAEFGKNVDLEALQKSDSRNHGKSKQWKDSTEYIRQNFSDAIMYWKDGQGVRRIAGAWEGGVLLDFSTANFSRFLKEQIERHIEMLPESSGFCIDRTDFIKWLNDRRDDGVSWADGPCYSMVLGWNKLMNKLGAIAKKADKVIYCNPLYSRVDLYDQISGFYSEVASNSMLNTVSLMGLRKPVVMWTQGSVRNVDDLYIQQNLHMGSFITAPLPENNHTIRDQGKALDDRYLDYGLMFDALRGRQWVLEPNIISFAKGQGDLNVFDIPGGFVVFATWIPSKYDNVQVSLNGLPVPAKTEALITFTCVPGDTEWITGTSVNGPNMKLTLPVKRGCGALKIMYSSMTPEEESFENKTVITMYTTIPGAQIRYTTDGSKPDVNSRLYQKSFELTETTCIRMAAFENGKRIGRDIWREYVRTAPRAPYIESWDGGIVPIEAKVINPYNDDSVIRFTTDNSEPNSSSATYTNPLELTKNTDLRARLYRNNEPSISRKGRFRILPPLSPEPAVSLLDLKPLQVPQEYRIGSSWNGNSFRLAGKDFSEDGLVIHPPIGSNFSDIVYSLKPDYERFVAVVGIDADGGSPESSVIFKIYFDKGISAQSMDAVAQEEPYWQTEVMRQNEYWCIDLPIPNGQSTIRLRVDNAGDDQNGDYAAWVRAGFIGKNLKRIPRPDDILDPNNVSELDHLPGPNLTDISAGCTWKASSVFEPCRQMQSNDLLDASMPASLFAFSTNLEKHANVVIDLKQVSPIDVVQIYNRVDAGQEIIDRASTLGMYISDDGLNWKKIWQAKGAKPIWTLSFNKTVTARFIKLQLSGTNFLHLRRVHIFKRSQ